MSDLSPYFSISELAMFPRLTDGGSDGYDPSRAVQNWRDELAETRTALLSNNGQTITYVVDYKADGDGQAVSLRIQMPVAFAKRTNLPPVPKTYSAYTVADTVATSGGSEVDPYQLTMFKDAVKVAAMFGISQDDIEPQIWNGYPVVYGTETRRNWGFMLDGSWRNAGELLKGMYEFGVGAPGHWERHTDGSPTPIWVQDPAVTYPPNPQAPVAMPLRDLKPTERIVASMVPGAFQVMRTDVAPMTMEDLVKDTHRMVAEMYSR